MTTKAWLHSLAAAAIGGAASAVLTPIAMPDTFNFSHDGLINIAKIAIIGAIVPVLTLLKQSPLPTAEVTATTTVTTTVEGNTKP
jgi:hypothetical protein